MVDLILICFLTVYAYIGLKKGFLRSAISFSSTIVSLLVTSIVYRPISEFLYNLGLGSLLNNLILNLLKGQIESQINPVVLQTSVQAASTVLMNVIIFLIVVSVTKIGLAILVKSLDIITKLPVLKQANSVLGLVTGLLTGVLISYVIIGILAALGENSMITTIQNDIKTSIFAVSMYENNILTNILTTIMQ